MLLCARRIRCARRKNHRGMVKRLTIAIAAPVDNARTNGDGDPAGDAVQHLWFRNLNSH
jgi:hypothetical protein